MRINKSWHYDYTGARNAQPDRSQPLHLAQTPGLVGAGLLLGSDSLRSPSLVVISWCANVFVSRPAVKGR